MNLLSSGAAKLVTALDAGVVVEPHDVAGIQQVLQILYNQWRTDHRPSYVNRRVQQFDRRELTRKLALLFHDLCTV